jgi:hypothetical protein
VRVRTPQSGTYTIEDKSIQFSSTSREGSIDFSGVIDGDRLELHVYSRINGYRSFRQYQFERAVFPHAQVEGGGS